MKLTKNIAVLVVVTLVLFPVFARPLTSTVTKPLSDARAKELVKSLKTSPSRFQLGKASAISGTQTELTRELNAGEVYLIKNRYIVPESAELIVGEGVTLMFEVGAGMIVQGKILVSGTQSRPAIFRGVTEGREVWDGIKIFNNNGSKVIGAWICGAKTGIELSRGAVVSLGNTVFWGNRKAFHKAGHYDPVSTIENCIICNNGEGVTHHFAAINFKNCSIVDNDGGAVSGSYYGDVKLDRCVIVGNGRGISDGIYKPTTVAHMCIIFGNRDYDVCCRNAEADFRENWWGAQTTQVLLKKGDGVKLPNIQGKFVDIAGFLKSAPDDCGSHDWSEDGNNGLRNENKNISVDESPAEVDENTSDIDDDAENGEEVGYVNESENTIASNEPPFTKPTPVPDTMQVNKAVKIVKELVEDDVKAMNAGKLDKQKFAMKLIEDSKLSDKVEVKFVLFRNSFNLLLNVGDITTAQKLFDVVYAKFGGRFASAMANFSMDTLKKMANVPKHAAAAKPLLALVDEARESCKACDEAAKELGKRPSDQKARARLAINAIKIFDWELALKTYAKNDDDRGKICSWELMEPNARTADYTSEKVGDYWWGFVDGKDERRLLFKSATNHAAYWYRKALAEGKMSELKKKLVEKRLSSISRAGKLKAKAADKSGGGKLKCYKCKGEGKVKVFRLESCAECDGKGVVKTGYKSGSDCAACGRRGRALVERDAECPVCHGKGEL